MNSDIIKKLLESCIKQKASDIFITSDNFIYLKVHGKFIPASKEKLSAAQSKEYTLQLMSPKQQEQFKKDLELNFSIKEPNIGRFRVSAFFQLGNIGCVIRNIHCEIPTIAELHLPEIVKKLILLKKGLILFVGATGSGKSSSLASIIEYRNQHLAGHIITLEDPIEFIYEPNKCIITQREIDMDTASFETGLRNALRQAPDVMVIGEIRSRKIMRYAMQFAETGHLCIGTLHANNSTQAIDRITHFFPKEHHLQLWDELSLNLKAVFAEELIAKADGEGRIPAIEVLINTPSISSQIRKGNISDLRKLIARGQNDGMQTLDQSLLTLFNEGKITAEDAIAHADSKSEVSMQINLQNGAPDVSSDTFVLQE